VARWVKYDWLWEMQPNGGLASKRSFLHLLAKTKPSKKPPGEKWPTTESLPSLGRHEGSETNVGVTEDGFSSLRCETRTQLDNLLFRTRVVVVLARWQINGSHYKSQNAPGSHISHISAIGRPACVRVSCLLVATILQTPNVGGFAFCICESKIQTRWQFVMK